ncbi:MAG TPA: MmgE/PrpD family protein [Isosphaeraceae bacterium]|jgi:2-methylcitrate dehydratase PrpD
MAHTGPEDGPRGEADRLLQEIAAYTLSARIDGGEAWETARYCLLDALGCGLLALGYPACGKRIRPVVPGAVLPGGARVPGTDAGLLGASRAEIINAVSNAFLDGGALRTYRHAPNTGARKSWAAGDATCRAVRLALLARQGEMGYPTALTAPIWGVRDALFRGLPLVLAQPLRSYVVEHVLFKIAFPAEFHAQAAVEAAIALHPKVAGRIEEIETMRIETQESAPRIIDKAGPLNNPADRDHCLQYVVAIGLLKGTLRAEDYEDKVAADPRIDWLRDRMVVAEDPEFTVDYLDPVKRSIGNSVQVIFRDGRVTETIRIEYPLGHRRRRAEGIPLLMKKFEENLRSRLPAPGAVGRPHPLGLLRPRSAGGDARARLRRAVRARTGAKSGPRPLTNPGRPRFPGVEGRGDVADWRGCGAPSASSLRLVILGSDPRERR